MKSIALIASAAAYAACFPPLSWHAAAWVALVPFFAVASRVGPLAGAAVGLLWGTLATVAVAWWLPVTLAAYFSTATWVGWVGVVAIGAVYAGIPFAAFGAWVGYAARRQRLGPLGVALAWGGAELLRTYALPDPWALLGYSQVAWPTVMQIADVGGVYGVGVLVAAVNGVLAGLIAPELRGRRFAASAASVAVALVATVSYGRWQLAQSDGDGTSFTVGVVQSGIERGFRWEPAYRELGVTEHLTPSATLRHDGVDLLVWPEHAVSFYVQESTPPRERLFAGLAALGGDVVLGGPHYARSAGGVAYHNAVFLIEDAKVVARYDKQHLVPLAETSGPTRYSSGDRPGILPAKVGRLGALVCFESMFPALARAAVRDGAEVLVNLTNDSWLVDRAAFEHHLDIASVRAIESRRWLIRAAATGYSAFVDPWGRIVARSAFERADTLSGEVTVRRGLTLYDVAGDWPLAALALLAVARAMTGAPSP